MGYTVIFDSNVLYPAALRSILMYLATSGLFRAQWTWEIHEEWIRNLLIKRPDLNRKQLEAQRDLMIRAIPDSVLSGYDAIVPLLTLPDPDDRHVLAAAIYAKAERIITASLRDFPAEVLTRYQCIAQHPGDFIVSLLDDETDQVLQIFEQDRAHYRNPPYTSEGYRTLLQRQGLIKTCMVLKTMMNTSHQTD
ncbi:MAG: PIN domain-containing protein [Pseudomonadota bacterium]